MDGFNTNPNVIRMKHNMDEIRHNIRAPMKNDSIEQLELSLESISKMTQSAQRLSGFNSGIKRNSAIPTEKQLEMRIRLRKKLEKKKNKCAN